MHSLGNDFVLIDREVYPLSYNTEIIQKWGDRNRGIGFDQFILYAYDHEKSVINVDFYNQDGSFSPSCGNGTRALALLWNMKSQQNPITIQTKANTIHASVLQNQVLLNWVRPKILDLCGLQNIQQLSPDFKHIFYVDCGNPHLILFINEHADLDTIRSDYGKLLESHSLFPNRVNVSFVKFDIHDNTQIYLSVYERGVGPTLACGTAALAVFECALQLYTNLCKSKVSIFQKGGITQSQRINNLIIQEAEASFVFEGDILYP